MGLDNIEFESKTNSFFTGRRARRCHRDSLSSLLNTLHTLTASCSSAISHAALADRALKNVFAVS